MTFKPDIIRKIQIDFTNKSDEVFELLTNGIEAGFFKADRVIRCIIFLSKGNIDELKRLIKVAANDTRDVMFWAEYENLNSNFNYIRIRDFNKTFEESTNNVIE